MANRDDFLSKSDRMQWARFMASDEAQRGLRFLRVACPRKKGEATDADLIRNSVGFDFWQKCLDEVEKIAEIPPKPEKIEDDRLEP